MSICNWLSTTACWLDAIGRRVEEYASSIIILHKIEVFQVLESFMLNLILSFYAVDGNANSRKDSSDGIFIESWDFSDISKLNLNQIELQNYKNNFP